ncbi:M50 family metallopeptidase [Rathayibacter soli]|uniref:M50 family metallopeptidase n=1 Tax=Rathayibacter soli TaxID=3144168 RepID=UPI0027E4ED9F|nr:site-2 protease family protein [Glaciibacter superstes]
MDSVLLFVLGVVIFVIGLAVSIALHELGHLSFAKLFGVKVTQYMIGFGKTLFSFRRGETEYGVKAIPLGGYIAMIGMFPPKHPGEKARNASTGFYNQIVQDARTASAETVADGEDDRAFYRLAPWKRIIIMFAGPFMNLVIAVVLFGVIVSGIGVQQYSTTVSSVSQCVLPATSSRQTCDASDPQSPAAAAGIRAGDKVISFGGKAVTSWTQMSELIKAAPSKTTALVVERNGKRVTLEVTPTPSTQYVYDSQGNITKNAAGKAITQDVGVVGISPGTELVQQPIGTAFTAAGDNIAAVTKIVIDLPQRMVGVWNAAFGPSQRAADSPVGIVGVGRMAGDIASSSVIPVIGKVQTMLSLLASLNIALFVMNMIPLLPLDGGHILGAAWEWIKRAWAKIFRRKEPHPVDMARWMPVTFVVVVVLGAMSVLLAYADIVKPITLG